MATPKDNLAIALAWLQAMNDHDAEAMASLCTDDVTDLEVAEGEVHAGRDYLLWAYQDLFVGYPDCSCEIINKFAGDDQALVEVQWQGTNTGEFRGEPPTNGRCDIRIAYIFRFRDGKICAVTEYYDMATLVAQLEGKKNE